MLQVLLETLGGDSNNFDPISIINIISRAGLIGVLVLILYGGYKRWWVFGWQFRDQEKRLNLLIKSNEKWMEVALRGTKLAEDLTAISKREAATDD